MKSLNNVLKVCETSESFYRQASARTEHPIMQEWLNQQAAIRRDVLNEMEGRSVTPINSKESCTEADVTAAKTSYAVASAQMTQANLHACVPHLVKVEQMLVDMLRETADLSEQDDVQDMLRLKAMRIDEACKRLPKS